MMKNFFFRISLFSLALFSFSCGGGGGGTSKNNGETPFIQTAAGLNASSSVVAGATLELKVDTQGMNNCNVYLGGNLLPNQNPADTVDSQGRHVFKVVVPAMGSCQGSGSSLLSLNVSVPENNSSADVIVPDGMNADVYYTCEANNGNTKVNLWVECTNSDSVQVFSNLISVTVLPSVNGQEAPCENTASCAEGQTCVNHLCVETQCSSDVDCVQDKKICRQRQCVSPPEVCINHMDCSLDSFCVTDSGKCEPYPGVSDPLILCTSKSDCLNNQGCVIKTGYTTGVCITSLHFN